MTRRMHITPAIGAAPLTLILGIATPIGFADDHEKPFAEAHIFFELNHTDGDLGIHAKIDGDPWNKLAIEDPRERRILFIKNKGRLGRQGLTEIFFESAEPAFDELTPDEFFRRFPEGEYEIEGVTLDGNELESEVEVSHVMPAPAQIYVNGISAAEGCDTPLEVPDADDDVEISWDPVTMSHPDLDGGGAAVQPPVPVTTHNYEVVVEIEDTPWKTTTILPPGAYSYEIPDEILELSDEVKFEVLVREDNYNQTAVESCFVIVEDE